MAILMWAVSRTFRFSWLAICGVGFAILGTAASLSSGPFAGVIAMVVLCCFEFRRQWIKPALSCLLVVLVLTELLSNRHFYSVIDRFTFSGGTAWYRGRLLEVGLAQWHEYWLVGTGPNSVRHWGRMIDGRKHVDIVNHFLLLAVYGGFLYPLLYLTSHGFAIRGATKAVRSDPNPSELRAIFGLTSGLIAIDIASFTVGVFGPIMLLLHCIQGILVSISESVVTRNREESELFRSWDEEDLEHSEHAEDTESENAIP
jgi:hypothetical protein